MLYQDQNCPNFIMKLLHIAERGHWWFQARRNITSRIFWESYIKNNSSAIKILSIGSSTGAELEHLSQYGNVEGMDCSEEAVNYCNQRGFTTYKQDIVKSTLEAESYDVVVAMDILEHINDDHLAYEKMMQLLKPNGYLLITVPALMFLWSQFDELGEFPHQRRYSKEILISLLRKKNVQILKVSYYNFFLLPLMIAQRKLRPQAVQATLTVPTKPINSIFKAIFGFEKNWLRHANFPIGGSLIAICQKRI